MSDKNQFIARPTEGRALYERHVEQLRSGLADDPDKAYAQHGFAFFNSVEPEIRVREMARLGMLRGDAIDHYNLGTLAAIDGDLDGARAKLEKALEMDPNLFDAAYQLAAVFEQQGDLTRARQMAQRALDLAPDEEIGDVEEEIRQLGRPRDEA